MRSKSDLRAAQQRTITRLYEEPATQAVLGMGAGKTASALTAFVELKADGFAQDMFVLAPKRVSQLVWPAEPRLWEHLRHLKVVFVGGTAAQRLQALKTPADIYAIGIDNTQWFVDWMATQKPQRLSRSVLCIDESSRFKNPRGKRGKALFSYLYKNLAAFLAIWELTGTPRPNGYEDQFMPLKLATRGKLWGKSFDRWREANFYPVDYNGYNWRVQPEKEKSLIAAINTVTITIPFDEMPDLPMLNDGPDFIEWVEMPRDVRPVYDTMKKHLVAELQQRGETVAAANMAVASGKLSQLVQGFLYENELQPDRGVERFHDVKMERLLELIETLDGEPALIAYEFQADLKRLQAEFPGLPYLGAGVSDKAAIEFERGWNEGRFPVAAVHPACLHPATLVLTEHRGWVKLIDVRDDERVHDGVEFVSHSGCRLSGVRPVIDLFGLTMTPDHLVLMNGEWWAEAYDVRGTPGSRAAARYAYTRDDPRLGAMLFLRCDARDAGAERAEGEPQAAGALPELRLPQDDGHASLAHLEGAAVSVHRSTSTRLQALRRAGHSGVARVAELREILARHAGRLLGRANDRAARRERPLLQGELPMGDEHGAAGEQAHDAVHQLPRSADAPSRVLPGGGRDARGDHALLASARDGGRSADGLPAIDIPTREAIEVYDLVDCGPRHRFAVRNAEGEVFIVHNSAGHGLNLQHGGAQLFWYGMTWSAELYDQLLKRLHRPGQHQPVFSRPILMRDTVDELKYERVRNKMSAQAAFQRLLKEV